MVGLSRRCRRGGRQFCLYPKKSGEMRMCVDFRDLNALTVDDCFPIPHIEVMLHRSSHATFFSKLDLASGFHQIEVESESRPSYCIPTS